MHASLVDFAFCEVCSCAAFCSKDEQKDHPFAAINALKFYEYNKQKKKQQLPFKHIHIASEVTIEDESEEIDNILGKTYCD